MDLRRRRPFRQTKLVDRTPQPLVFVPPKKQDLEGGKERKEGRKEREGKEGRKERKKRSHTIKEGMIEGRKEGT